MTMEPVEPAEGEEREPARIRVMADVLTKALAQHWGEAPENLAGVAIVMVWNDPDAGDDGLSGGVLQQGLETPEVSAARLEMLALHMGAEVETVIREEALH